MPTGPFGEILGTTGTLDDLNPAAKNYKSKVVAPRNPKLLKGEDHAQKMTPSKYMFEAKMSTEQKLANTRDMRVPPKVELLDMGDTTHQKFSQVNIDEPMFQPFPSEIFYQQFEPFKIYEVPLTLRNNDKVPRLVKVTQADSPYFKVISPHNVGHKVGPGLPTTFKLQFRPDEKKDYYHELVCITEREKFVVPVQAIGGRAVLDFPDEIQFPMAPVKYPSSKTVLVRNIGSTDAKFSLQANGPFSVSPVNGVLPVDESLQVTVEFKPLQIGEHKHDLLLTYDTGEEVYISLYGAAQDSNIRLDRNSIRVENTFISMANQRTVTISNRTAVIAHFRWTQFATHGEEESYRSRMMRDIEEEQISDNDRFLEECITDPTLRDRLSILERTFKNRKNVVADDRMVYEDDVIQVEPAEGDIWPNSTFDVSVVFKPREAKTYMRTAFCDITGRESRLPLRIRGDGIGPKVQFSFESLDMGNLFISSSHTYEVAMVNKGDIDAIFCVLPKRSIFGPCFSFNPSEGIILPGGHQAIQISFTSPLLGDFQEEFKVQVDGQPEPLTITFTGSVVGPTFQFDVPKLKFGVVSYGFLNTRECTLSNTSLVPMTFHLRVPGDGSIPSICAMSDHDSTLFGFQPTGGQPKEFEIIPERGTLTPQSETKIQVKFISNTTRKYEMALVVDVENVGEDILSLPISAKCIVPPISALNSFLDYGRCFLGHPYQLHVKLHNDTDLPAKYEVIPQIKSDIVPLFYRSPVPKGILEAHSISEVPMIMEARDLHELDAMAQVLIFGSPEPPLTVQLGCVGEGPVIHIAPLAIDWGTIPVLEDRSTVMVLSNESLIPAKFKAYLTRPKTVFRVEPVEGEVPPEQSVEIRVIACLNDCVKFDDKLQVSIGMSQVRCIPLSAVGDGTTVVSDPPLTSVLDLGPNFSNRQLQKTFVLTNKGRRHQQLVWSTEGFQPIKHKKTINYNPMDMKNKYSGPVAEQPKPVFKLTPYRMDMGPGESLTMELEGFVKSPEYVKETLLCHAIIGRQGGKELVMRVNVSSEFISPLVEFSSKSLFFRIDKHPGDELECHTKEITLSNVSSLPLTASLCLKYPFQIVLEDGGLCSNTEIEMSMNEARTLKVQFDPSYKDDFHIRTIDEILIVSYREHPHVDYIALRGEVYFPNLQFESMVVDFGCILNNTEVTRYVNITNNSPMEVKYKWAFLIGNEPCTKFTQRPKPAFESNSPEPVPSEEGEITNVQVVIHEENEEVINKKEEDEGVEVDIINELEEKETDTVLEEVEKAQVEKLDKPEKDNRVHYDDSTILEEDEIEKGQLEEEEGPEAGIDKEEYERNTESRMSEVAIQPSHHSQREEPLEENTILAALLSEDPQPSTMGIEEVFDILPLYGTLRPGDTEQVTLTFYGHADIWGEARATCEVEGGPTYEINLKGEASLVEYKFDSLEIDYGKQMYDQVASAEITLMNCGKVGFEFTTLNIDPALASHPKAGLAAVIPHAGYIEPMSEQTLTVKYLPGVPETFVKTFNVQVAHFEPDTVKIRGEGVFPRISLDLPRPLGESYNDFLRQAEASLGSEVATSPVLLSQRSLQSLNVSQNNHAEASLDESVSKPDTQPSVLEKQMEMERLIVKEFASGHVFGEDHQDSDSLPANSHDSHRDAQGVRRRHKTKALLPEYTLDFGYVVYGTIRTHIVRSTNTGWFPVSFQVDRSSLHSSGFNVELDKVRQLPGSPDHETVDFVVSFDPRGANLPLGQVEVTVPINVVGGPVVRMRLCADVTMPDMEISDNVLDFSEVKCGECKVVTVQLHNNQKVRCDWNAHCTDKKLADKHMPLHVKRKLKQEKKPNHFEVLPPTGSLMPGQRANVQVKFMPTEEKFYEVRIPIRISQSSQRILLLCKGLGREPRLDFEPNLQEFGPVLAHSSGDEQEVIVKNPCNFPVEFYNLEYDKGYLEEERILRLMRGYDENNTILLPPRSPSEKLPPELQEFYEDLVKKYEDQERMKQESEEAAEEARKEEEERERAEAIERGEDVTDEPLIQEVTPVEIQIECSPQQVSSDTEPQLVQHELTQIQQDEEKEKDDLVEERLRESVSSSMGVGELEITPVSAAIARYLGIDLSSEGKAARNRRGIAVIINGAPLSGKTSSAIMLAKKYEAALLTVDSVVMEAIANGNTPAGLRAREMCSEAAKRRAEELRVTEGEDGERKTTVAGGLSVEAVTAHTQQGAKNTDPKGKPEKHLGGSLAGTKTVANTSTTEGANLSQVPSSPPPLLAPIARRLSISGSVAGEQGLMSCVLPEELLVEILAERLQLSDCHSGVVFDGLETLFSQNQYTTSQAILKALNNRRFLFFVTLKLDYSKLKEQEWKKQEENDLLAKQQVEAEKLRLEEMSEEEYDALPEEEKAEVDRKRLEIKKLRIKREMEEKAERDRLEQLAREEEQRRLEEEKMSKRRGKKQLQADGKDGKKSVAAGRGLGATESKLGQKGGTNKGHDDHPLASKAGSTTDRPESHHTEKSDTLVDADGKKKKSLTKDGRKVEGGKEKGREGDCMMDENIRDPVKESELLLMQRFRTFEHGMKDIVELLENWDRAAGQIKRAPTPSERSDGDEGHPPSGKKGKAKDKHEKLKEKEKDLQERLEREKAERAAKEAAQSDGEAVGSEEADGETDEPKSVTVIGVPHILVDCGERNTPIGPLVADSDKLPTVEEVMDGLGLGPKGPPIPPPASFSVIPNPVKRRAPPLGEMAGHYMFVASSPDDPNIGVDEKVKEVDVEEESSGTPEKAAKEDHTPAKGKGKDKQKGGDKQLDRKRSAGKRTALGRRSSMQGSPPPGASTPASDVDGQSTTADSVAITEPKNPKLTIFRWVVPANSEMIIRLRFQSEELGQFDQTLNFEIVGTRRRYQVYCRGICAFPTISREPRIVFPHRKKTKKFDEIVLKKFILTEEIFEFGPLLVGKTRDKYKEGRYPENMEKINILNTSPLEADISFCFLKDSKAETYLLDPPNMVLKPGETQELSVWAYPKVPGRFEDAVVCCVRENPEPIVFKVCCDGVRPELELDKKQLHFDKVLLHRKDTKTIYLRNSTLLPVSWKLSGLENLGDDFSMTTETGVIEAKSEYAMNAYFRAMKPVNQLKKMLRLEVSDVENIMGVVQTEAIQVLAEAYDVALDMSFPKGADGGLDFGTIRVMDETKQTCSLKNKGKYEIAYKFVFEENDPGNPGVTELFSVLPDKGSLSPLDRPTQVQVIFRSRGEIKVKDVPILKCQVIEPNVGELGEVIASIPIKVSVRSVFSKYNILPLNDINFGSLLVNSKKSRTFVIENKGEFDFKYNISKMVKEVVAQQTGRNTRPPVKGEKRAKSRDGSSSGRSVARTGKKADSISDGLGSLSQIGLSHKNPAGHAPTALKQRAPLRQEGGMGQSRLMLGAFTVYPGFGIILPNGHQVITVDCVAEHQGRFDEELAIDVTDRQPTDHPGGIPYRLLAEACIPAINIDNVGLIFEEHRVCRNLSVWQHGLPTDDIGVYGEDEKRFVFNNVIVGRKSKARFKISNTNKVPCDVVFSFKPVNSRGGSKQSDIFEVEPQRTQIPNHSCVYATVTFSPPSMQSFSTMFEAAIEGVSPNQTKGRSLIFEITGEGNLPRINVSKPSVRNKRGQPLLLFKRTLLGRDDTLPLVLSNEGTLPSKVDIDLIDPDEAFVLKVSKSTSSVSSEHHLEEGRRRAHTASVIVDVGEAAYFDVIYRPTASQRSQAHVRLSVIDNQYEDSVIQLVGEGYQDDITFDNITSSPVSVDPEKEEGNMADDDVPAAKPNLMKFGDCFINEQRVLSLALRNHSSTDCVRFQWPEHLELSFTPQTGHLHPGVAKDISVTFKAMEAKTLLEVPVACSVTRITFDQPIAEVCDWDDRIRSVKWVDAVPSTDTLVSDGSKGASTPPPPPSAARPAKKKVVESEPEPVHQEVPDSSRSVELLVSAVADYCKYKCKVESVQFKDTLMFQTRVYEFVLSNKGTVKMDFNWQLVMENFTISQRSVTFYSEPERPSSRGSLCLGDIPFTVEPEYGTILPGKKTKILVKFSPLDVNDFEGRLVCRIPNLENDKQGPVIGLKAKSLMPYCHFELEDSDYISGARRNPELRGPGGAPPGSTLDANTRVLEFKTIGVGAKKVRQFSIVNPTNQTYNFEWKNEDEIDPKRVATFTCVTPKGVVRPGKKAEIIFEFTPLRTEIEESFWRFNILDQNISVPFLMVGDTRDPDVSMDRSHLNFRALLIGHQAVEEVYLINNEEESFPFQFQEDSCHSAGFEAHLLVEPMKGNIPPKSKVPINFHFMPSTDKEANFNLVCKIKRKTKPLCINVKAEGYSMSCTLMCEDSTGNTLQLSPSTLNEIKFGEVEVHEQALRNLYIINSGKFNFDYKWEVHERTIHKDMLTLTEQEGGVKCGEKQKCSLTFCPPCKTTLRGCELTLKIAHGPEFNIVVTGLGVTPGLHLSFLTYDFGPVFVHRAGLPARMTTLKLTNRDRKEISVDSLYTPTAHLHHSFEACVIAPGQTVNMPITFYPREAKCYQETLTFEINGLSRQSVEISGLGTEIRVEVANPKNRIVNLGNLVVHKSVRKQIAIVNNSLAPITFSLAVHPTTSQLQQTSILTISPTQPITLEANGGQSKVDITFSPKCRIPQFSEEVMIECAGITLPLFVTQGSCLGMDIRLDADAIPFGAVIQRSQSSRKLVVYNQGDMNARFMWDIKRFQPDFSIAPVEGYLTPGMEVTFDVNFHPQEINQDIRYEKLRCIIQGSPHPPVTLTLTGMCTSLPPVKEIQHFTTHVRQKETKQLMICNKTNQTWNLKPVIDGEQWSGPVTLLVEPQQTRQYEIVYHPLTMTAEGKKHLGSVFFPIPDGTGIYFNLGGTAEPPKASNRISKDVPCKTKYVEMLAVENWLKKPQRFRVRIECLKSDKLDVGTTVKGMEYIDVPSHTKKDYKLNFHAYKEGVSQVKVTFINEQSGEYQYYELMFRATRPGVMSSIDLITPVRQSVPYTVILENPLNYAIVFSVLCNVPEVLIPSQFSIPAQSSGRVNLEYQPLKAGEVQGRLEFNCNDLGNYTYDLNLKATTAGPERPLYFRACLGTSHVQVAKFLNFAKQKADYACKADNGDFHADRTVAAAPGSTGGTEIGLDVTFEPSKLGEQRATLTISSPHGGEYAFPLFGTCVPPKPQGPYVIKAGSTVSIMFRNVFSGPTPFTFQVDNPAFHLTKSGETIRSRKDHRIVVGFDGNDTGSKASVMGKLIVSCARSAGGTSNVQWVYYLKGITP